MIKSFHQHAMLPPLSHDERERQVFVGALRAHLSSKVMPGNYILYREYIEPTFKAQHQRTPNTTTEVRRAMESNSYYQFWSAAQRRSQEMMWESIIDPTERSLPKLVKLAKPKPRTHYQGTLILDPTLVVPRYHTAVDIHLQPGGYHTDFVPDDIAAGAIYDRGINIYSAGSTGILNEYLGELLISYYQNHVHELNPLNILDMGCAIGNSTLPWARAYPKAKVLGIDVAAPQLRYAYARARDLNIEAHFSQQNAERTSFLDHSFDLVVSHIMLHETSRSALDKILKECCRLLKPGGVMLHLEIPRGNTLVEKFLYNWETYNNNETFAGYLSEINLFEAAIKSGFMRENVDCIDFKVERSKEQNLYSENPHWKILIARGS